MIGKRLPTCPRCEGALGHTGAFWTCAGCDFSITDQALRFERMASMDAEDRPAMKEVG
jgi:hypothetical protein